MKEEYDTVNAVYPSPWIKAEDLQGRAVTVKIAAVDVQEFRQRDGSYRVAVVLTFDKARKKMICNKTQAHIIAAVLHTERLAEWPGGRITLAAGKAPNGRPTICVLSPGILEEQTDEPR